MALRDFGRKWWFIVVAVVFAAGGLGVGLLIAQTSQGGRVSSISQRNLLSQSFGFVYSSTDIQDPVEQESQYENNCSFTGTDTCVHNPTPHTGPDGYPTGCAWDVDDHLTYRGNGGVLDVPATQTICMVAYHPDLSHIYNRVFLVHVSAPKSDLTATVATDLGMSWQIPAVKQGHVWTWDICIDDATPGPYAQVANSNGGLGTFVNYTLTISPTGGPLRSVSADFTTPGTWQLLCGF